MVIGEVPEGDQGVGGLAQVFDGHLVLSGHHRGHRPPVVVKGEVVFKHGRLKLSVEVGVLAGNVFELFPRQVGQVWSIRDFFTLLELTVFWIQSSLTSQQLQSVMNLLSVNKVTSNEAQSHDHMLVKAIQIILHNLQGYSKSMQLYSKNFLL